MDLQNFTRVHLELTEKCNAACPLCLRTNPDGLKKQKYIGNNELNIDDIANIFTPYIRDRLIAVHLCGTYGDPIMAKDCQKIVASLSTPTCAVSMSTNGSARDTGWWAGVGEAMSSSGESRVDFHIDGLADTNSFYIQNTSFEKIIANAEAFIKAGGNANWEFIPFKHNEHQIEKAHQLSKKLGFKRFTLKKSNWMFTPERPRIRFITHEGEECFLEAPSVRFLPSTKKNRLAMAAIPLDNSAIHCFTMKKSEIYISCECLLYPCCWTARHGRNIYLGRKEQDGFSSLFYHYQGKETFNLRKNRLEDVLKSKLFHDLENLWRDLKPKVCYRKCGLKNQPEKTKIDNI